MRRRSEDNRMGGCSGNCKNVIRKIGYTKAEYRSTRLCGVVSTIHEQSPDINQGVMRGKPEEQGQVTRA